MTDPVTSEMLLECLQDVERRFSELQAEMAITASEVREMNEHMASFLQALPEKQQPDLAAGRPGVENSKEEAVDRLWAETRRMEAETAKLMAENRKHHVEELRRLRQGDRYIWLQTIVMMAAGAATVFGTVYLMLYVFDMS